jgi:hypothetical protein
LCSRRKDLSVSVPRGWDGVDNLGGRGDQEHESAFECL